MNFSSQSMLNFYGADEVKYQYEHDPFWVMIKISDFANIFCTSLGGSEVFQNDPRDSTNTFANFQEDPLVQNFQKWILVHTKYLEYLWCRWRSNTSMSMVHFGLWSKFQILQIFFALRWEVVKCFKMTLGIQETHLQTFRKIPLYKMSKNEFQFTKYVEFLW